MKKIYPREEKKTMNIGVINNHLANIINREV